MGCPLVFMALLLQVGLFIDFTLGSLSGEHGDVWRHYDGITKVSNAQFKLDDQHDLNATIGNSKVEEPCDFNGEHLLVVVSPQPPLVDCFQNLYGYWLCNGSNIEVIKVLEQRFNFEADWLVLTSNHLDRSLATSKRDHYHFSGKTRGENNSHWRDVKFTGALGLVGSGRAAIGANGYMPTPDRERSQLLSEPFDSFRLHFLLSKSVRDHDHIFIKPFQMDAWIAILASALFIVPVFYLINLTSAHYCLLADRKLARLSLWDCLYHLATKGWLSRKVKKGACLARVGYSSRSSSLSDDALYRLAVSAQVLALRPYGCSADQRKRHRRQQLKLWTAERRQARRLNKTSRKSGFFNIAYILWYVVGSLTTQGGETEDLPHATSTRILVAFWWLYLIVITSIHSGILTAILTFPRHNDFIQTLDDFIALNEHEGGSMKVAVDKYGEVANLFSSADNLHKSPLRQLLVPSGSRSSAAFLTAADEDAIRVQQAGKSIVEAVDFGRHRERLLDDVLRGQSAYIEERSFIDQIITQEYFDHRTPRCLFKSSRYPVDTIPMSLALSVDLGANCRGSINTLLRQIMRTGLAQKWRRKYEVQGNDCLNTVTINAGDVEKIQYQHIELATLLLSSGVSLGLVFLFIEVVWLFTADDDSVTGVDSSSSSSSSDADLSSGMESEDELRFSHRMARLAQHPLATTRASRLGPVLRRVHEIGRVDRTKRLTPALPANPLTRELPMIATATGAAAKSKQQSERRGERRARRLHRALDLIRRLHEGKLYSNLFLGVSSRMQTRVRRASLALDRQFKRNAPGSGGGRRLANANRRSVMVGRAEPKGPLDGPIRRRRRRGTLSRRPGVGQVQAARQLCR